MRSFIPREVETLWTLFTAPVVWALHFLVCYVVMAIACAKGTGSVEGLMGLRMFLGGFTLACLLVIVGAAYLAWRQWGFGTDTPPHDAPTREERRLFQGFATLLLSGLSFIAVVFVALPILFIPACMP